MTPYRFDGYDKVLGAPAGWDEKTDGKCQGLPVAVLNGMVYSAWSLSWSERLSLVFGGKVRLCVVSGQTQPPVALDVIRGLKGYRG